MLPSASSTPPNRQVAFKKWYYGGRDYRVFRPKMIKGEFPQNLDFDWYYFCKVHDMMVPLPLGYVPVIDGKDEGT